MIQAVNKSLDNQHTRLGEFELRVSLFIFTLIVSKYT